MKLYRITKRILCLVLALCMLLSLSACASKVEAQSENFSVTAKGINTAKLKLKIKGVFPEGTAPVISYIDAEDASSDLPQILLVTEKEIGENSAEYIITGLQPGFDELKINFIKDDISYSKITAGVTVGDDLKISNCLINISETQDKFDLGGGIITEIIDDYILEFSIPDEDFNWETDSYDEDIISVSGPYYDEDEGTTTFRVSGKEEGKTDLTLVNKEDGKKISLGIESYDIETDDGEEGETFVKVISSDEEDYEDSGTSVKKDDVNVNDKTEEQTNEDGDIEDIITEEVYIDNLYVPENYEISDVTQFADSKSKPVIEMEVQDGDSFFFINAYGNAKLKDVRSNVTDKTIRKTKQELTIAGIKTEYYNVNGVDQFLFERDGVVYLISFPKESDIEAHTKIIENINWVQ